ncbi:mitochondrial import inner membrane translocase subunit TIM14-like [Artibeus jamaicensis]|uniref:mitochondrial import inner membrane translocase subunit TIM14-like n=1 Tax=Artibeus jamaicensis TaxID=9417 RepID=UPI00235AA611|nr:mitochondrial import inner membrane translocase subunit TIM14-like [Artibeus jamaicensis]
MKHMEPQVKQVLQSPPKSAFSVGYNKGGFEPKMTEQEAALILGPCCQQMKNRFTLMNYTFKSARQRGSPYKTDKTHEAKDLVGQAKNMK